MIAEISEVLIMCMAEWMGKLLWFMPLLIMMLKAFCVCIILLFAASVAEYLAFGCVDLCGLYVCPRWIDV